VTNVRADHPGARREGERRTLTKFLLVGASGTLVNLGLFGLLLEFGVNRYIASPIAIEASILSNFMLHDRWTFRSRRSRGRRYERAVVFNVVSLAALVVSYGSFVLWSVLLADLPALVHQCLAIPPATLFNFLVNSRVTFRDADAAAARPISEDRSA
jgi:dolichol-phosphate mannosyltransferase